MTRQDEERRFIVAPSCTGKTTFLRSGKKGESLLAETDAARTEASKPELARLRKAGDWPAHNKVWHALLREWVRRLPSSTIVMAHSFADAQAMGATVDNTRVVLLPEVEHTKRIDKAVQERSSTQPVERDIVAQNRSTVEREVARFNLTKAASFEEAVKELTSSSTSMATARERPLPGNVAGVFAKQMTGGEAVFPVRVVFYLEDGAYAVVKLFDKEGKQPTTVKVWQKTSLEKTVSFWSTQAPVSKGVVPLERMARACVRLAMAQLDAISW